MANEESVRPVEILLVEDNLGDVRLTQETFNRCKMHNSLSVARDGEEAMDFLRSCLNGGETALPDVILLDLNLPRKDGREVLAEIKKDPRLKHIPVIILTVSGAAEDILRSYEMHANCYMTKPVEFSEFVRLVQSIEDFWLTIVRLPPR